ncbi:metallophosphoesterase family protein [Stanieria cyanosphaera]|nr:metallophosphoesterase family protein [Stanieria cyanosphaera]
MTNSPKASTVEQNSSISLLSDPFLQLPTSNSVRVVWFTDFPGEEHQVVYGNQLESTVTADTTKLSRVREDEDSQLAQTYLKPTTRDIWRHEAIVTNLTANQRLPYQVISVRQGEEIKSKVFTLAAAPQSGTPLKILLTSDHQLMPMTAANLQKVVETIGRVDAVFFPGDLVNIPDRASEWFDDKRGGAFFPCLQGRANYQLEYNGTKTIYRGGEIIQHAPLFTAIGNHEVMGRYSHTQSLKQQFGDAVPRFVAEKSYQQLVQQINPKQDPQVHTAWIKANSFNTDTYEEIFTLPQSINGGKKYYAVTFGDIRLVVLYITNIWRSPELNPEVKGRYQEREADLNLPEQWGYGQHIFEPITPNSTQYQWLKQELQSEAFQQAKYKIVMFHHPPHTLGGNIVPPYTNPIARIEQTETGEIKFIRYEYPPEQDYIIRDVIPLLKSAKVQLVFYGHSHLWNRFVSSTGINFLESSNVGNSYGAHLGDNKRLVPKDNPNLVYAETGDPNGLEPITPTLAPLQDEQGNNLSYLASNEITSFSILDTKTGIISSYRYDTRQPNSKVIKFDQFALTK